MYRNNHITDIKTNLLIEHSWFLYNIGNKSDRAGGLSICLDRPKVSVLISHIKAMYNVGGNVDIHVTDYHENTSSVTINNSIIAHGLGVQGGGLNVRVEALQLWQNGSSVYANISLNVVTIFKTMFVNNSASDRGGGVFITQYEGSITDTIPQRVSFTECQFIGNSIKYSDYFGNGAAVHIFKREIPDITLHMNPLFSFYFTNCTFKYNKLDLNTKESGILNFVLTNSIIIENNFTSNEGTAIFLQNSNVQFSGNIIFENNSALQGGALSFCQSSKMYLPLGPVQIDFINNSATSTGGAINVREQCTQGIPPCFFQPAYQKHASFSNINATLQFINNVAKLAGDAIYGGQADRCYMITYNSNYIFQKVIHHSHKVFAKIFNLTLQNNVTWSTISSQPYGACFCNTSEGIIDSLVCSNMTYPREVIPGQTIRIGVAAVGQANGTVPLSSVYFEFSNILYGIQSDSTTQLILINQINRTHSRCNICNWIVYCIQTKRMQPLN